MSRITFYNMVLTYNPSFIERENAVFSLNVLLVDDDECELGRDNCASLGPKWICNNIEGSFRCVKKRCKQGERLTAAGRCVRVDCRPGFKPDRAGRCKGGALTELGRRWYRGLARWLGNVRNVYKMIIPTCKMSRVGATL